MMEGEFAKRCIANSVPEKTAKEVYEMIKKFAEYGFNKSHSACYARIAYETAYLKTHFPECFMAANCTINADNKNKLIPCLSEIKNMQIPLLPPLLNKSKAKFSVENNDGKLAIRYGFNGIEGVGVDVANHIESFKNSQTFFDFLKVFPGIRVNTLVNMINGGVFDIWGSRKNMCGIAPSIIETLKYHKKIKSIYHSSILDDLCGEEYYDDIEYSLQEKINKEKSAIHCCLHGHPLDSIRNLITGYDKMICDIYEMEDDEEASVLCYVKDVHMITTAKGDRMAFVTVEDEYDEIETVVFPKTFAAIEHILKEESMLIMSGRIQKKDEKTSFIVNTAKLALSTKLVLYVEEKSFTKIEDDIKKHNGIAEIISVNTENKTFQKKDYCVDYQYATQLFTLKDVSFYS